MNASKNCFSRACRKNSKVVTTLKKSEPQKWTWSGARFTRQTASKKQLDTSNRLQLYKRARYYDPKTGEFASPDPLEYVDGMSLYAGYFTPNGVDPIGLSDCKPSLKNVPDKYSHLDVRSLFVSYKRLLWWGEYRGDDFENNLTGMAVGWEIDDSSVTVYASTGYVETIWYLVGGKTVKPRRLAASVTSCKISCTKENDGNCRAAIDCTPGGHIQDEYANAFTSATFEYNGPIVTVSINADSVFSYHEEVFQPTVGSEGVEGTFVERLVEFSHPAPVQAQTFSWECTCD